MYQYKVWDWDRPGNIVEFVTRVNQIRRENPALHLYRNLRFYQADNPNVICYGKQTPDGSNNIVVVVNMDPFQVHDSFVHLPLEELGLGPDEPYEVEDLLNGPLFTWRGPTNWVRLDPATTPAHIFRLRRRVRTEHDFDYF